MKSSGKQKGLHTSFEKCVLIAGCKYPFGYKYRFCEGRFRSIISRYMLVGKDFVGQGHSYFSGDHGPFIYRLEKEN